MVGEHTSWKLTNVSNLGLFIYIYSELVYQNCPRLTNKGCPSRVGRVAWKVGGGCAEVHYWHWS